MAMLHQATEEWCKQLPKVELHAHLNGSIRDETILSLLKEEKNENHHLPLYLFNHERSLSECFEVFSLIHKLTNKLDVIKRITKEVLEDFAAENVKYLELRTTPKHVSKSEQAEGMTKREYVEAVLSTMNQCAPPLGIRVGLLLSINRTESLESAYETVRLAEEYKSKGVVGIDFSGNPTSGSFVTYLPALQEARRLGLPITVHLAEVVNNEESEAILNFNPERVGHACYLDDRLTELLKEKKIPLEVCLTSNACTMCLSELDGHHFKELHAAGHPVILCTDDRGIFSTSVTKEYLKAVHAFRLSPEQLFDLSYSALDCCFLSDDAKKELRHQWHEHRSLLADI